MTPNVVPDVFTASALDSTLRQIEPRWNFALIAASVAVSLIGSFTSTQLICCARSSRTFLGVLVWTILSSFVFGFCAVFCLHEIAMLACELDVPVGIHAGYTILSAMLSTIFTFTALAGGTLQELYHDKRDGRKAKRASRSAFARSTTMPQSQEPLSTTEDTNDNALVDDDWVIRKTGDYDVSHIGTVHQFADVRSDDGLLEEERIPLDNGEATGEVEEAHWHRRRKASLATFVKREMRSLLGLKARPRPNIIDSRPLGSFGESRTSFSSDRTPSIVTSTSNTSMGHLPRARKPLPQHSGNVVIATILVVYSGLSFSNLVKGLLWSLSITSMHYCGMMGLIIPDGYIRFNPLIVLLAAFICWSVCIVAAACMSNMTDLLSQQLLFAVVAACGCSALHWTGKITGYKHSFMLTPYQECGRQRSGHMPRHQTCVVIRSNCPCRWHR